MWRWVICAAALALASCGSTDRLRYKTIIEIETPEGLRTGSVVREISVSTPPSIPMLGEDKGSVKVKGEAVAVDLPNGRTLFALLTNSDGNPDYAARGVWFLFRELGGAAPEGVIELWRAMPKTKAPRIGNPLPLLATFRDKGDPRTIEKIDPANLTASLGSGVRLKRIIVERTSEPVTAGIERRLPWLVKLHGGYLHRGSTSRGAPLGLHGGNFSSETFVRRQWQLSTQIGH